MRKNQSVCTKKLLLKAEKKIQNQGHLVNPALLPVLLIFFVILDYLTIHQLIDEMFYQSWMLTVCVTGGIAVLLEGIPCIAAHFFMKEKKYDSDIILMAVLAGTFLILFIALFALRWHSRELIFSDSGTRLDVISMQSISHDTAGADTTTAENMMTILLGISPLATSILAFCLACSFSVEEKRAEKKRLIDIHLQNQAESLEVCAEEMKDELKHDLAKYDAQMYQAALTELHTYAGLLKNIVRQRTAMHIGTANAVSRLLEKNGGSAQ